MAVNVFWKNMHQSKRFIKIKPHIINSVTKDYLLTKIEIGLFCTVFKMVPEGIKLAVFCTSGLP